MSYTNIIDDAQKSSVCCGPKIALIDTSRARTQGSNRRQRRGTGQKPSENQGSE